MDVYVSSISNTKYGNTETTNNSGGGNHNDSPTLTISNMVPTITENVCGTSITTSTTTRSTESTDKSIPQRQPIPSASMEIVAKHLQATGFSEEVASIAAAPRRASTNRLYDGRWRIISEWAHDNGVYSFNPTAPQLANFLHFLWSVKELDPRTIKGDRTTLASVLIPLGVSDAINSPVLSQLLKCMEIAHPLKSTTIPIWDLGIVMSALKKAPYEPLASASLKELTYKTIFLIAMASGSRRSELQTLMFAESYCQFAPLDSQVRLPSTLLL
jgi:hypothetical protein